MKALVILFLFVSAQISAQNDTILNSEKDYKIFKNMSESYELEDDEQIFIYAKHMPEFPGGKLQLRRFVAENVIYPAEARKRGIEGTVFVKFEVKKNGKIGKVEIQKGVHELLDNESVKVVKSLPEFKPGMTESGKFVNIWYSIPITFKLN